MTPSVKPDPQHTSGNEGLMFQLNLVFWELMKCWMHEGSSTETLSDRQTNRVKRSQISMFFQTTWRQKPVVLLYFREQRPPCFWSEAQRLSNTKMSAVNNNEPTILKSKLVQVNINIDININKLNKGMQQLDLFSTHHQMFYLISPCI